MERWLFETPWMLLSAIAVAAVALLVSGNNRQNARLKYAGIGVLALAMGLWALSYFVETPREITTRQTREWVAALVAKDSAALAQNLHPKAVLARWNRDDILAGAVRYADQYGLEGANITGLEAQPRPTEVQITLSVLSRHDAKKAFISAIPSTWELIWVKDGDQWVIRDIVPIKIGQSDRSQFRDDLFGRSPR